MILTVEEVIKKQGRPKHSQEKGKTKNQHKWWKKEDTARKPGLVFSNTAELSEKKQNLKKMNR